MAFERLIQQKRIVRITPDQSQINQLIQLAERDLIAADKNLKVSPDWAYSMAYNAILQICRALVLSEGFRPRGGDQHATIVDFSAEKLGIISRKRCSYSTKCGASDTVSSMKPQILYHKKKRARQSHFPKGWYQG